MHTKVALTLCMQSVVCGCIPKHQTLSSSVPSYALTLRSLHSSDCPFHLALEVNTAVLPSSLPCVIVSLGLRDACLLPRQTDVRLTPALPPLYVPYLFLCCPRCRCHRTRRGPRHGESVSMSPIIEPQLPGITPMSDYHNSNSTEVDSPHRILAESGVLRPLSCMHAVRLRPDRH